MGQCYFQLQTLIYLWASAERIYGFELVDFYNETDVRKIYGMERLFATQVRKIYIIERAMDRLSQRQKSKLRNSTEGNVLWLAEIFTRDRLERYWSGL